MARRINYLNNKDILKEIHKSKTSFCSFLTPDLANYDLILLSVKDVPKNIKTAKIARAERLTKLSQDEQALFGNKVKSSEVAVEPKSIIHTELVFRVMT